MVVDPSGVKQLIDAFIERVDVGFGVQNGIRNAGRFEMRGIVFNVLFLQIGGISGRFFGSNRARRAVAINAQFDRF